MSQSSYLLLVWVTMAALSAAGLAAVLIWAVRSRQFQDQDHARYLALEGDLPPKAEDGPDDRD